MELAQLKYFVAIAETLSFTRAAELSFVSQPALSYQIKRLEEEFGVRLFERHGRSIALTMDGQVFLPLAQAVLSRANEAMRIMREQAGGETGEVTLGVAPSVAAYLVPNTLASFHQVFPRVRVILIEDGDVQLQQGVSTGSLDFAILGNPGSLQSLDSTSLGSEDLLAITGPAHRLAGQAVIELTDLRNDDFVLPASQFHLTTLIVQACRQAGFEPNIAYSTVSLHTLKNLVRAGLGVSMLPTCALVGGARNSLAVFRLKRGPVRELYLVKAKDRDFSPAAQVLLTHMRTDIAKSMTHPPKLERAVADAGDAPTPMGRTLARGRTPNT